MSYNYQQLKDGPTGQLINSVLRLPDCSYIPFVEGNTDYQEYLKWVAEGNTPTPADE
jgi:hypothetical protein